MATTINADNGAVSGSAGLKYDSDSSGVLALQTNGTTAVSVSTGQVVTLTNALPVASGGTGLATATGVLVGAGSSVSAVAAGTTGNLLTSNGTTWISQAAAPSGATGDNTVTVGTSSGTWTKPATVKSIKVTVVAGGGNSASGGAPGTPTGGQHTGGGAGGGAAIRFYPAASIPGPQPYTVGGAGAASSFGVAPITVVSATAGGSGSMTPVASGQTTTGGAGSNGNINIPGQPNSVVGTPTAISVGGDSLLGWGGNPASANSPTPGTGYGGGASGGGSGTILVPGSSGAQGVVIIEEFY